MWIIKNIKRDEAGSMIPMLALFLPVLILMSFAIIECSVIIFDWHRASEATRRGAREIAISEPIADLSSFVRGSSVTCQGTALGSVSCTGASVVNADVFGEVLSQMQAIQPAISAANITITYQDSGLGDPTTPGGILPLISVRIENLSRPLMAVGGFMGLPSEFTYPTLLTNQMGNGIGPTS